MSELSRKAVRHWRWARQDGLSTLIEEDDLRPISRASRAWRKWRWRHSHGVDVGTAAVAVLAFGFGGAPASAKEYTFALVPKNMNNPFFDQARDGCKKAEKESAGKFRCEYIGPGEHGGGEEQVQVVNDLIAKKVDGIAVSPANAAAMGNALKKAKEAGSPVLTWDSDLL